jgi:hypothetical protein
MKNIAKNLTLGILVTAFVVGCVGAFVPTFLMEGYTSFLTSFAPILYEFDCFHWLQQCY